ncbi:MAG: hypothetical protein GEU99_13080 [Luteitalea sp.]|nr:hypothetical protein [Luteitalea sp.]
MAPAACGPINFFGAEESGRAFTERVGGTFLLTIEEVRQLARHINRTLLGSALGDDRADLTKRINRGCNPTPRQHDLQCLPIHHPARSC